MAKYQWKLLWLIVTSMYIIVYCTWINDRFFWRNQNCRQQQFIPRERSMAVNKQYRTKMLPCCIIKFMTEVGSSWSKILSRFSFYNSWWKGSSQFHWALDQILWASSWECSLAALPVSLQGWSDLSHKRSLLYHGSSNLVAKGWPGSVSWSGRKETLKRKVLQQVILWIKLPWGCVILRSDGSRTQKRGRGRGETCQIGLVVRLE